MDSRKAGAQEMVALLGKLGCQSEEYLELSACKKAGKHLVFPGLEIQMPERKVLLDGKAVGLARKEFDALCLLALHPGCVYTKDQIYWQVWSEEPIGTDNAVMCLIYSLRRKLGNDMKLKYIHTVHGVGYKFEAAPSVL